MSISPAVIEAAEDAGLHYVTDSIPGISRVRKGEGFAYRDSHGKAVTEPSELDRIKKLTIPPAYERVWICPDPRGHLQATGYDARGRKQYRYHPRFREVRDEDKFRRMLAFGKALPKIRKRVDRDLALSGIPMRKVLAVVVYLLERSLIRVGNEEYAKENRSFGLTTLHTRHVKIEGSKIDFNFLGKSKIRHRIEIHDLRLARVIKKIQDLPGQELFQYVDDDGQIHSISSADVNSYLADLTGEHFTAKDFRTWWGTLLALIELGNQEAPTTKIGAKRAIARVMTGVAKHLGNTPAISRKCYVHPAVVDAFQTGSLADFLKANPDASKETVEDLVVCAESTLLALLADHEKQAAAA